MDFSQFWGLMGITAISALVELVKPSLGKKRLEIVTVLVSMLFGIIINIAISFINGEEILKATAVGILTGLLSNIYHDIRKSIK